MLDIDFESWIYFFAEHPVDVIIGMVLITPLAPTLKNNSNSYCSENVAQSMESCYPYWGLF